MAAAASEGGQRRAVATAANAAWRGRPPTGLGTGRGRERPAGDGSRRRRRRRRRRPALWAAAGAAASRVPAEWLVAAVPPALGEPGLAVSRLLPVWTTYD